MKYDAEKPDFKKLHEDTIAELQASDRSRHDLLDEIRDSLRGLREGLPLFEEINGPQRANLHRDTLNELTQRWKEYSSDEAGLYKDEDVWDLVSQVRASNAVQTSVFLRYSTGKIKAHADTANVAPNQQPRQQGRGCLMFAALLLPVVGLTFWMI